MNILQRLGYAFDRLVDKAEKELVPMEPQPKPQDLESKVIQTNIELTMEERFALADKIVQAIGYKKTDLEKANELKRLYITDMDKYISENRKLPAYYMDFYRDFKDGRI